MVVKNLLTKSRTCKQPCDFQNGK